MAGLSGWQSPAHALWPSPSTSVVSSICPSQLLSTPSQMSSAEGLRAGLASSQSPPHSLNESPSSSASLVPASEGQPGAAQLLFRPSHTCGAPGKTVTLVSSQSPPHGVQVSLSRSRPSSINVSQSLSARSQISAAPGWVTELASLQSPWHSEVPSASSSASLVPASAGQPGAEQLLFGASQIGGAAGWT